MTRRERLEHRIEKRRKWADGRRAKAASLRAATPENMRNDWAFITQPGHIPERARMIARDDRAHGHSNMATYHDGKAAGLESQLERSIFSDDPDAIESLEAKASALDASAARCNAINAAWRKAKRGLPDEEAPSAGWSCGLLPPAVETEETKNAMQYGCTRRKGPMDAAYDRANARRCRERIEQIKADQAMRNRVEAAPNGITIEGSDYVSITFAEKPDRQVLTELKTAGFRWGRGSWCGKRERIPCSILALVEHTNLQPGS